MASRLVSCNVMTWEAIIVASVKYLEMFTNTGRMPMKRTSSDFFHTVYGIVAQIPPGCVLTYGQIAAMAGNPRAARIVGYAMNRAPAGQDLPCHRVVNREGAMAPGLIFGGAGCQRAQLEAEGVTFRDNGCINLEKHLWWPTK